MFHLWMKHPVTFILAESGSFCTHFRWWSCHSHSGTVFPDFNTLKTEVILESFPHWPFPGSFMIHFLSRELHQMVPCPSHWALLGSKKGQAVSFHQVQKQASCPHPSLVSQHPCIISLVSSCFPVPYPTSHHTPSLLFTFIPSFIISNISPHLLLSTFTFLSPCSHLVPPSSSPSLTSPFSISSSNLLIPFPHLHPVIPCPLLSSCPLTSNISIDYFSWTCHVIPWWTYLFSFVECNHLELGDTLSLGTYLFFKLFSFLAID